MWQNTNLVNLEERVLGSFLFLQLFCKLGIFFFFKHQASLKPQSKVNTMVSTVISLYCIYIWKVISGP